jgi:hypothetical protein
MRTVQVTPAKPLNYAQIGGKNDMDFSMWYPKYKYYSKKREAIILEYLDYKNNNQQLSIL